MLDKGCLPVSLKCLFIMLLCVWTGEVLAQGRAENNWIFGNTGQLLQFNFSDDSLESQVSTITPFNAGGKGSSAVATDPVSGEVLFYTDGVQLYDAQGKAFGPDLGADPNGNQQVAIAPVPGDTRDDGILEYYVFVNVNGNVRYYTVQVEVDRAGFPVANVTGGPVNTGVSGAAEPLMVVPNEDNTTYYIITQQANTAAYQVIDAANPTAPATYTTGGTGITANSFAYNEATGQLAVASSKGVQILKFDPATGKIEYENNIGGINAFDAAWSADGSKLYISTGNDGNIRQYDAATGQLQAVTTNAGGIYGLKLGPDGNIYYLYQDPVNEFKLGRITYADSVVSLIENETALFDDTNFGNQQFSETTPGPVPEYSISNIKQAGNCANNPVQLIPEFPAGTPDPDSIVWYVNGQKFSGVSPAFTPEEAGGSAAVIAYWNGDSAVAQTGLTINEFDLQVPLVQDTTICPGDMATLKANPDGDGGQQGGGGLGGIGGGTGQGGGGSYAYYWSTGATTDTIQVSEAGVYWVLVTDQSTGCTAYAESNVKEYQVQNQTYNVWYFGNGAGIDFNTLYDPGNPQGGQITPVGDGAQDAPEAVASVSDNNGDILFYTDGQTVYFKDRVTGDHTALPVADPPGATGIGGDPAATQVAIVQVPGADGVFYIFTTTEVSSGVYALRYSIFDLRRQEVVSSNNLLFKKSTERIAIFGGNGNNAVLLAHEYGNNTFRAYPITDQGIGQPVTSSVGSVHSFNNPEEAEGYMKFGGDADGTVVAVAVGDRVELFNFDDNTLKLSEAVSVDFSGRGQPYGVEIFTDSLENTVLYVSTDNGIYAATVQRPLSEGANIPVVQVNNTGGQAFGAIQQGPDGQLYVARPGAANLGVLAPNPDDPASSGFNTEGIPDGLPGGATSGLGLPGEVRMGGNSFPEPNIAVTEACVGSEVSFAAEGRDNVIETYTWTVQRLDENGNFIYNLPLDSATAQNFTMSIDTAGFYRASVLLSNECDQDTTLIQEFTMGTAPEVTLPESTNLCQGTVDVTAVDPAADDGTLSFSWVQVGAVGGGNLPDQNTITITEEGTYQVTITNADGCTSEGEVFVVDSRPEINLPNDFTLCQGETRELDAEIASPADPGYEWIILDNNGTEINRSNEPVIEVTDFTPDPGTYLYTVTVTDDSPQNCFVQDTVVVTMLASPGVTGDITQATCGNNDGAIDITVTGDPAETYSFTWTDETGAIISTDEDLADLSSGNYTVTVTNTTGCSTTQSFGISDADAGFTVSAEGVPGCDNTGRIRLEIENSGADTQFRVTVTGDTTMTINVPAGITEIPVQGIPLAPGTYNLSVRGNQSGCVQTATVVVDTPEEFDFNVPRQVNVCDDYVDIEVEEFDMNWEYAWYRSDGSLITRGFGEASVRVFASGIYTVEVDPKTAGVCPGRKEIDVRIKEPFNINIVPVDEDNSCQTGERQLRVDFEPAGAESRDYIYNWTLNGNPLPNATRTITVTQSGDYGVTVREKNASCSATDLETVNVSQPLNVSLFYGQACADGSDIPVFAGVQTTGTDSLVYAWYNPEGQRIPAGNTRGDTLFISPDFPEGKYRVVVTSYTGGVEACTSEASGNILRNPVPAVRVEGESFVICSQDPDPEVSSIELQVDFAEQIVWTLPNGRQLFNANTITATEGGMYLVEMTNTYGCTTIDSIEVIDDCKPRIVAPNAFRPGGVNNEFFVHHRYVSEEGFEVRIYNRWGELMFQSNDPDFRWDGTYKGREAPLGTYPYVIHYKSTTSTSEDGRVYEKRGGITVLR